MTWWLWTIIAVYVTSLVWFLVAVRPLPDAPAEQSAPSHDAPLPAYDASPYGGDLPLPKQRHDAEHADARAALAADRG